jgi:hypothetical protein
MTGTSDKERTQGREYYLRNKDKAQTYQRKKRYGLEDFEFTRLLQTQNFKCPLCCEKLDKETACVDHCHDTTKVRGLLCRTCNMALGLFKDSIETLENAINYLDKSR